MSLASSNRFSDLVETELRDPLGSLKKQIMPERDAIHQGLTQSFLFINEEFFNSPLDVRFSGSTCVTCLIVGNKVYTANAGDSRAIVVRHFVDSKIARLAIYSPPSCSAVHA